MLRALQEKEQLFGWRPVWPTVHQLIHSPADVRAEGGSLQEPQQAALGS